MKTLREKKKAWRNHKVKRTEVVEKRKRKDSGRGRPKNGEDLQRFYHIKAGLEGDGGGKREGNAKEGEIHRWLKTSWTVRSSAMKKRFALYRHTSCSA